MQRVKASSAQLKCLIDFMKLHKDFASGARSNDLQGRIHLEKQWQRLVETLNSLGGPIKNVNKWKQTWRDYRNNTKKKAIRNKQEFKLDSPECTQDGSAMQNRLNETRTSKTQDVPLLTPTEQMNKEMFLSAVSDETINNSDIQSKPKIIFQKLVNAKLNIAMLRRQLIRKELEEKQLKKQILKEEIEHKRQLCELQKKEMLLKIEILKTELENKRNIVTI